MNTDESKTRTELLNELKESRQRLVQAEAVEKDLKREVEKSAHLASFPELNPNPVLELDRKGNIKYTNPATIRSFPDLATLGTKHPFLADWAQVVKELESSDWAETLIREIMVDSSYYEQAISPVAESQIRIYGRNITKRKKAEEALWSSEQWFSTTLRSIGDAVIATDEKACVKLMNSVAQALTGWNEKDAIGKPLGNVFNIVNEKTGKKAVNPVARVIREGVVIGLASHTALIAKDGTRRSIDDSGAPIKDDKGNIIGTVLVFRDVTEHRKMERDLNERVKELGCLYGIAIIDERPGITLDEIYQEAVELLPQSWQYPEVACAQITIDGKEFKTANYRETKWKQSTDIKVHGVKAGMIEVVYLEERPASDEGPFLKEERLLIGAITERLGRITERIQAEKQVEHLNLVLRAIRNVNQLITREKDAHKLIRETCDTLTETRGYGKAWLVLVDESEKPLEYSESGWGKDFLPLAERLEHGEFTICGRKALKQSGVVVTKNSSTECADCPVSNKCAGMGVITTRMECAERVWGVFSAAMPVSMMTDEEVTLFSEVTRDIAFALHSIELEKQRKQSEQNFQNSLDNSPLGIRIVTEEGELIYANQAILDIYGYSSFEELKTAAHQKSYTPESYAEHQVRKEKRQRGEYVPSNYEISIVRKNGEIRHLEVFRKEVPWNGKTQFQVLYIDVTDRKQAEEKLRENERKLRTLFEILPVGVSILDAERNIIYVNPALERILDISKTGLFKGDYKSRAYLKPDGTIMLAEEYASARAIKEQRVVHNVETGVVKEDGNVIWTNVSAVPVAFPDWKVVIVTSDITNRKQLEQALTEEKKRLEVTLRSTGDGVITTDMEGKVALLNRVAEQLTGWTQDEATGKPLEEVFHIIDEHTRKRITNPVKTVIKTGRIVGLINHAVLVSRDGTERIIADSGAPIHDEQGNLFGVVLVFRDITEVRRLEEEIQKTEKLQSVGNLAGGIAHDFNNYLTGIMGNISLAKRYVEPKGKAIERLEEAEKASIRARDLTQQLLTFSSGGAPIRKTISIGKLIEDAVGFASRGSNVRPEFSLPDDLWVVEADEGQINQVISNIIINADQAMPQGGKVNVEAKNLVFSRRRTLPLPRGNYVEITIRDYGIGIAKEHLTRIFEPFFTTKQKGSGLGLATSFSIIKKHGGHITVESKLGVGTTVHVYLPASMETAPIREEVIEEAILVGKGRILVMDDEEIIRELLYAELTEVGYEVQLTNDGAEAVERYSEAKKAGQPFDAVILDLTIPGGMGGKEAIKKLLELDPDVKAIVSSGYATDPIMSEYKEYGFSAVAPKPYSVAQIEKTLQGLLRKKR